MTDERRHLMVDIETMGTNDPDEPTPIIVSVGAVVFTRDGVVREQSWSVDGESCEDIGLGVDFETVEWWLNQPEAIREQVSGGEDIETVLEELRTLATVSGCSAVWAQGHDFDLGVLETAYSRLDMRCPWEFWEQRDSRTYRQEIDAPIDVSRRDEDRHDALADARYQARCVAATKRWLEGQYE